MRVSNKIYLKLIAFFAAFVGLAVCLAWVYQPIIFSPGKHGQTNPSAQSRGPASVGNDDDEGPQPFWDNSSEQIANAGSDPDFQGKSLGRGRGQEIFIGSATLLPREEAERRTGMKTVRARKAQFQLQAFTGAVTKMNQRGERTVELALFSDTKLSVRLDRPSVSGTNQGIYWGQVNGDTDSKVNLIVEGNRMNGTIQTKGHSYRIVTDGGSGGGHYIVEEDAPIRAYQ